ncbi:MAG: ATP-dependent DNA helicase RecG [Clostridia bacterium]|nr:ATP-dependent DNA helicase RecG [Clostridia bacterium]
MPTLTSPLTALPGIGPARAAAFARLGLHDLGGLLRHYPRGYENRGAITTLAAAPADTKCALLLTVATAPVVHMIRRGMVLLKFRAFDDSGTAEITFFNQTYLKSAFEPGQTWRFWGKVERTGAKGDRFALSSPACERWEEDKPLPDLLPVYRLTEGISQKQMSAAVTAALAACGEELTDPLPPEVRTAQSLALRSFALRQIHAPTDIDALAIARRRLAFDEFFTFALGLAVSVERRRAHTAPPCPDRDITPLLDLLPYALTGAQARVIGEIAANMAGDEPMSRIVIGDVGCGKTICAAAAMYIAVKNGRQAALMAPTEILARQHYADLAPLFTKLGIECRLLIGAVTAAEKRKIKTALACPLDRVRLPVIIGTQALLSDGVEFAAPGLIVTDEQHRFGVGQRATLAEKNQGAHLLVMSATPIPRTLALVLYGDLAVSRVDEMPPGRQVVDTFCVDERYRERLRAFIRKQAAEGGQVYVVCPAVEERAAEEEEATPLDEILADETPPKPPLKAAVTYAADLAAALPELRVAFVHGKLPSREKGDIMRRFADGEYDVLVSTTVIEVGVNVPNASLMIVENAERFGLSQLHQLRGRVGRGSRKACCVLVSDATDEKARERLGVMCREHDGFAIAEADLKQRGPGDFLALAGGDAIRQHGDVHFRIASLVEDTALLETASAAAKALLADDPELAAHPDLRDEVRAMFSPDAGVLS